MYISYRPNVRFSTVYRLVAGKQGAYVRTYLQALYIIEQRMEVLNRSNMKTIYDATEKEEMHNT